MDLNLDTSNLLYFIVKLKNYERLGGGVGQSFHRTINHSNFCLFYNH